MYQLDGQKLRVCAAYLRQERNRRFFKNTRILLVGHLLPTTEELLYLIDKAGAELFAIIAKPYSINSAVEKRLEKRGFRILKESYPTLENTDFMDELLSKACKKSQADQKKILLLDVGGYFAQPLKRLKDENHALFAGVVEDTTFGHNRYIEVAPQIDVSIVSVARSRLKEIEAHFVGRDAVHAVDNVLRSVGVSMVGRQALVIGYGMIGKNVARALEAHDLNVSVYDIRDHRNLKAFMMGYDVDKKTDLLRDADIVFAATGWSSSLSVIDPESGHPFRAPALSGQEILTSLKDNAVLASVGSKNTEFDIAGLRELAVRSPRKIGPSIKKYKLPNDDNVAVISDGTAVNFLEPSIPIEILDLVFAEIVLASIFLLKTP